MAITGFCITDNPIKKGQPFIEAIIQVSKYVEEILVVDLESKDGTRDILYDLGVNVLTATPVPKTAFLLNKKAKHENIIFFEAYEVYSEILLKEIRDLILNCNARDISVMRIVIEQNFQRIRWYPQFVHRVFRRGTAEKRGHTTNKENLKRMMRVGGAKGYLWACENCFVENIKQEYDNGIRLVQSHFIKDNHVDVKEIAKYNHWSYDSTPIDIPKILHHHLGRKKYDPYLTIKGI